MPDNQFHHNHSGRLYFAMSKVPVERFSSLCKNISANFQLAAKDLPVNGPDVSFQNFFRDEREVGLEWDIWMGFMVVANTPNSEAMVREIAAWLIQTENSN